MRRPLFYFTEIYAASMLYQTPSNLSYLWNFGSLAILFIIIQVATGLCLSWWYIPHIDFAFDSVDFIMREVLNGWVLRYAHANGASLFFAVVYIHIARSIYYNSFHKPRILVWWSGMVIFVIMILTAFLGYVLPWGQMSFWAATVITSLATIVPYLGDNLVMLIWGGFGIGQQTLTRFYSFHFVLPFILVFIVITHLILLHVTGSSDPIHDVTFANDQITFHPYYTYKDIVGVLFVFGIYFILIFFYPNLLGHPLNNIQANPGVTPVHIVPEWYFLPFYGILRAIPSKLFGVLFMLSSLLLLMLLPVMCSIEVKQATYRPLVKAAVFFFLGTFIMLGWAGYHVLENPFIGLSQLLCVFYVSFFVFMTILSRYEQTEAIYNPY